MRAFKWTLPTPAIIEGKLSEHLLSKLNFYNRQTADLNQNSSKSNSFHSEKCKFVETSKAMQSYKHILNTYLVEANKESNHDQMECCWFFYAIHCVAWMRNISNAWFPPKADSTTSIPEFAPFSRPSAKPKARAGEKMLNIFEIYGNVETFSVEFSHQTQRIFTFSTPIRKKVICIPATLFSAHIIV